MNIVVLDSGRLGGEPDYPEVDLPKFGWLQYLDTPAEEIGDRCWRSDVIVTTATPVDQATIDRAFKLKLVVAAGEGYDHIDLDACRARGIQVCNTPGLDPAADGQGVCDAVVATINAFLKGQAPNRVDA